MPSGWIKFRTDLATDPAVIRLGAVLGLDTFAVLGRLAAVWVWADTHADRHGRVTLVSRDCLDSLTQCAGFGAALESVGWLESCAGDGGGIQFPRFDRHMGEGAKARAQAAKRKERQRMRESKDGHGRVTVASRSRRDTSVTREEKRREEENTPIAPSFGGSENAPAAAPRVPKAPKASGDSVPVPGALDTPEFRAAWSDWLADRRERKKPVTERAARNQLADLTPFGPAWAVARIRKAISSRWAGLVFPDDEAPRPRLHEPGAAPVRGWVDFGTQPPRTEAS